ncbi:MAG TPA: hypothetical protein VHW03_03920 [Chthoniobacterales bacterium]|nr:hypothetical protein [Chthoniobacterales bacterium]
MNKLALFTFALLSSATPASAQIAVASPTPSLSPAGTNTSTPETSRIVVTGGEIELSSTDTAQAVSVIAKEIS